MLKSTAQTITLTIKLGKGGEATVYNIAEQNDLVAKIYHQPTSAREAKVRAMLLNPPKQPKTHVAIAWPTALLYKQNDQIYAVNLPHEVDAMNRGQFVGFLMPKITSGYSIFHIYNPVMRKQLPYSFDWQALYRTAYNLCAVVEAIHAKGYVIGDINESNFLVNREALVTIVDCDSFQVVDEQEVIHRCQVGKPEFTPPELQGISFKEVDQRPEHDLFGLGVLLFQLLMEGFHPFTGVLKTEESVGRVDLYAIRQGMFPYSKVSPIKPPPSAPIFNELNPQIQQLFRASFELGHSRPTLRPNGRDWQTGLKLAENNLALSSEGYLNQENLAIYQSDNNLAPTSKSPQSTLASDVSLAQNITGTVWTVTESSDKHYEYHFLIDGHLFYQDASGLWTNGFWKADNSKIYMELNNKYSEHQAVIYGSHMQGQARNKAGREWYWEAILQKQNSTLSLPHHQILKKRSKNSHISTMGTELNYSLLMTSISLYILSGLLMSMGIVDGGISLVILGSIVLWDAAIV